MLYSCPNHELSREIIIRNFYARLSCSDQSVLDTSCIGSFMMKTIAFRWDLLEIIKRNSEDWDLDEGKESGMTEKLLANPFAGDGTLHPDLHLIYVDEVCGLFKLAGMLEDVIKKKVFPLYLKGKALTWFRLCDDIASWNYN